MIEMYCITVLKQVYLTRKLRKIFLSVINFHLSLDCHKKLSSTSPLQKLETGEMCSQIKTLYHTDVQCMRIVVIAVEEICDKTRLRRKSLAKTGTDASCNKI